MSGSHHASVEVLKRRIMLPGFRSPRVPRRSAWTMLRVIGVAQLIPQLDSETGPGIWVL